MLCSLSAKYDVHAANKLFSNALKTNNNSVHIGTAFHLAELCNVRPRPAEKPRAGHSRRYTWYAGCTASRRLTHACARLL